MISNKTALPTVTFIVGPTATGKSALAFHLAEKQNAYILSADSRQVYQGLEITSGADVPAEFSPVHDQNYSFFQNSAGTKLFGLSILSPTQPWSVGQFQEYFQQILNVCLHENKNLIVVGGSGLYSHAFHITDPHLHTHPNFQLRAELENLTIEELQQKLLSLSPAHYLQHNPSDWNNPRRLIRAIEIETAQHASPTPTETGNQPPFNSANSAWIGLTASIEFLEPRIRQRVETRIQQGAIQEVEKLLATFPNQKLPAFSTTGVKEIQLYLNDQIDREELIDLWTLRERQYAKRQLTWFKKRDYINWKNIEIETLETIVAS